MYPTRHLVLNTLAVLGKPTSRAEVSKRTNANRDRVGSHLRKFVKEGLAEKVAHGLYVITPKGNEEAEKMRSKYGSGGQNPAAESPLEAKKEMPSEAKKMPKQEAIAELSASQYKELIALSHDLKRYLKDKYGERDAVVILRTLRELLE